MCNTKNMDDESIIKNIKKVLNDKKRLKLMKKTDNQVLKYINFLENIAPTLKPGTPTKPVISTKSATCKLNVDIDRYKLCSVLECEIKKAISEGNHNYPIKTIHYLNEKEDIDINVTSIVGKESKGGFNNQATIVIDVESQLINLKYFNGSISMTGCKGDNSGMTAIKILLNEAKKFPFVFNNKDELKYTIDECIKSFDITLINCNYELGFDIDREKLYKILIKDYGIFASYSPNFYHATKIGFMWNKSTKDYQDGVCICKKDCICGKDETKCRCMLRCLGKTKNVKSMRMGFEEKQCKKITMSVFQNGKVIITGGNTFKQTMDTYNHMNNIFIKRYKDIVKYSILDFEEKFMNHMKQNLTTYMLKMKDKDLREEEEEDLDNIISVNEVLFIKTNKLKKRKKIIKKKKIVKKE